jgi:TonB family protein
MSAFSNTRGPSERYDAYTEQFRELFHRHGVSYGKTTDFMQLAPKLIRRDEFRVDFSMLMRWIQQREEGRMTVDQMMTLLGSAVSGSKSPGVPTSNLAPLMVFLSGLGGWGGAGSQVSNGPESPAAFRVRDNGALDVSTVERRAEESPIGYSYVESGTGQDAGTREPSNGNRVDRIRQQLEELDGRAKQEVEAPKYREITPVEPPVQNYQASFANAEQGVPPHQDDIFRAFRSDVLESEKRDRGFTGVLMRALTEITGDSVTSEKYLRMVVVVFGFLVLLPPAVVCILLYRDSVQKANESSMDPFVTREQGVEVSEAASGPRRVRGPARTVGQSRLVDRSANRAGTDEEETGSSGLTILVDGQGSGVAVPTSEIPVMHLGAARIHVAAPEAPPMVAEVGAGSLAGMPVNRGGAENWMSILGHTDEIEVSPRPIPMLETVPAKIRYSDVQMSPVIAETESKMPGNMPKAVVEMSYPVVLAKADAGPGVGRALPAVAEGTNGKMTSAAGGGSTGGGLTSVKGSPTKQFDLIHPSVAVSAGLLSSNIVKFQMPAYPKAAKKQRLEGDVLVRVLISEKGKIDRAVALNGPVQFKGVAEKAVRHWRYKPYVQNGQPVQVQTWVTFHFAMHPG